MGLSVFFNINLNYSIPERKNQWGGRLTEKFFSTIIKKIPEIPFLGKE